MSDAVVVWRCWVLYSRKRRPIVIPLLLTVSNIGMWPRHYSFSHFIDFVNLLRFTVVAIVIAALDVNILSLSSTAPAPGVSAPYTGNIVVWSLSLATNLLTTAMVAFKSW